MPSILITTSNGTSSRPRVKVLEFNTYPEAREALTELKKQHTGMNSRDGWRFIVIPLFKEEDNA